MDELTNGQCANRFVTSPIRQVANSVFTIGWGGRIRTSEYGGQSPAPYRLATPQFCRPPRPRPDRLRGWSRQSAPAASRYEQLWAVQTHSVAEGCEAGQMRGSRRPAGPDSGAAPPGIFAPAQGIGQQHPPPGPRQPLERGRGVPAFLKQAEHG